MTCATMSLDSALTEACHRRREQVEESLLSGKPDHLDDLLDEIDRMPEPERNPTRARLALALRDVVKRTAKRVADRAEEAGLLEVEARRIRFPDCA